MSKPKPRVDIGRESPDYAINRIISAARSHRTIPAAELSTPAANATDSMGRKQICHDHLHEDRARLMRSTTPSSEAPISSLKAEIATLEPINAKLKAKIATLESLNAKLKVENQKFEVTTSQFKGANDRLKSEIYKINSEGDRLKENIRKLNGENFKLMDKNRKLNDDNGKLRDDNVKLRGENKLLKDQNIKPNEDNEELKGDNRKLKDKNDSLESQLSCHDILIRSLKDEISEKRATLNNSRDFAQEVIMGFLTSGYKLPDGLPDHLTATYENAMELSKSITKELGPKRLPKHDAGPGSGTSPTLSGKSTDNGNGCVRNGPLLDEPVAKRLKRDHDPESASQSAGDDILRTEDSETLEHISLYSFHSDNADDDDEEV
ncbi:Tpr mlp1 mlp2-like protein [Lasiodiplodia theobromae]|uniref:Tpr mlp1 mlp2-like protein n=1 Tax=Lasiodiplodia theobromae TaxID=45133 RepID=UPI0015C407DB|nr:Tpr mlp1 mlp2-like protein [Lasiodiplodia theobromae]KAF4534953.1 Tpr mlp1 mlp2-like protein [Lasiodiplodia theobromae]